MRLGLLLYLGGSRSEALYLLCGLSSTGMGGRARLEVLSDLL